MPVYHKKIENSSKIYRLIVIDMAALFVAIFLLQELLLADCKF
jgi:hypothetical protein